MALAAEEMGFDSVWVGDHYLYRGDGRPERGPWEAWTLLAGLEGPTGPGRGPPPRRRVEQLVRPVREHAGWIRARERVDRRGLRASGARPDEPRAERVRAGSVPRRRG